MESAWHDFVQTDWPGMPQSAAYLGIRALALNADCREAEAYRLWKIELPIFRAGGVHPKAGPSKPQRHEE